MKFNPFIAVSSRCDDVQDRDGVNAFGFPVATGNQLQNWRVLLYHRPFRVPEELYGTLSRRSEPSRTRPGASIASRSGASVPIFFATFIEALHESRRCQAAREIARYQHLLEEARAYEVRRARLRAHSKGVTRDSSAASKRAEPDRRRSLLSIIWKWLRVWGRSGESRPHRSHLHHKARKGSGHEFGTDAA